MTEPSTTEEAIASDQAPPPIAIIAAYAGAILAFLLISGIFAATFWHSYGHGRSLRMTIMAVPMLAIMLAPSFIAAMLTRRSQLPVTISAAALAVVLQPGLLLARTPGLIGAAVIGTAIWLAATRLRIRTVDERRPVGEPMPLRVWMPVLALALGTLPFIARSMSNDPFKPIGYATMFMVAPFVWLLMVSWLSAIVPDRIGAFIARDALRRRQPDMRED